MVRIIKFKKLIVLLLFASVLLSINANAFFWSKRGLYEKGDFVYVYRDKWRPAKILKKIFHNSENYYQVTFVGLSKNYDVWTKEGRMHVMQ